MFSSVLLSFTVLRAFTWPVPPLDAEGLVWFLCCAVALGFVLQTDGLVAAPLLHCELEQMLLVQAGLDVLQNSIDR